MANHVYDSFIDLRGTGDIDLAGDPVRAVLIDLGSYTFSAAHSHLSDVPSGARVATAVVSGSSFSGGVFDCANLTWPLVATGSTVSAVIFYKETGTDSLSPLICYIDGATGLPFATDGGDVNADINTGGILKDTWP